jgi:hypothetical protein
MEKPPSRIDGKRNPEWTKWYFSQPEIIAKRKEYLKKYRKSERGKQARNKYNKSEKAKQARHRYETSEKGNKKIKEQKKRYRYSDKFIETRNISLKRQLEKDEYAYADKVLNHLYHCGIDPYQY